ncbi:MAG: terpene cyclase/mutase family protein [Gemmataceae bacterium]|nr:terpene cyclase/mutase family protein [Gemmataceae bacterium]
MRHILYSLLTFAFLVGSVRAADEDQPKMDEATKKATAKGLEWLAKQQNTDGSWSDGGYAHNTAITGYVLMAFMSQGHLPNQGLYGPEVAKGSRFLMAAQRDDGYIIGARGGNMYCHGMATLALSELWGQTGSDDLKPVVKKAIDLIVKCQHDNGGWRYEPQPTGADISVTIMQVMALRSAKNGGIHVPDTTMKKALAYIKSCYRPNSGGFTYQPQSGSPGFARTAAGCCVLFLSGEYKANEIPKAVDYLKKNFDSPIHFYYGHYYASHAMYQVGGKDWKEWYGKLVDYFVPKQSPEGSWSRTSRHEVGPVYQTSIAVISLSVPLHYLPIFQR